jgi:autotransporter-associated beta strand protein
MTPKSICFVAAAIFVFATGASAQSVTLGASSSNTLIQVASSAGSAQLSNGQCDIFVGRTNQDGQDPATISIRRGLVAFDVADNVPAGATITGVTLVLQDEKGMNGDQTISLSRMLRGWGQGTSFFNGGIGAPASNNDATWYYTFYDASNPAASPAWSAPGGQPSVDFSSTVSALASDSTGASTQVVTWSSTASPAMITDAQAWLDNPAVNFGWMIMGNESAGQTAKRFGGQHATAPESPPQLTIQYNTVPWTWTGRAGNSLWSSSGNWSAGSGSLSGNISVVLGSSTESGGTVDLLSTPANVSQLTFASAQPVILTSTAPSDGRLTLDNGSSKIAVAVSSSGDAIGAGVGISLNSDVLVTTTASSDSVTIAGNISNGAAVHGLEKEGSGTLMLYGSNTYTGGTTVAAGTLVVGSRAAIADGSNLTVGAEGAMFFAATAQAAPLTGRSAVPEPGTLAIVLTGAAAAVVSRLRRTLHMVRLIWNKR